MPYVITYVCSKCSARSEPVRRGTVHRPTAPPAGWVQKPAVAVGAGFMPGGDLCPECADA